MNCCVPVSDPLFAASRAVRADVSAGYTSGSRAPRGDLRHRSMHQVDAILLPCEQPEAAGGVLCVGLYADGDEVDAARSAQTSLRVFMAGAARS